MRPTIVLLLASLLAGCDAKPAPPVSGPVPAAKSPVKPVDAALPAPKDEGGRSLFDGKALGDWTSTEYGGEGKVTVENGELRIAEGGTLSGVTWKGAPPPKMNYEISLEAKKIEGNDIFCGIIFPVGEDFCSFVAGGWGGTVVGLSSVDGMYADGNDTTKIIDFPKGKWFAFRLRVTPAKIQVWIDEKPVIDLELKDRKISIHPSVELGEPLGLATYTTTSAFRNIKLRRLP